MRGRALGLTQMSLPLGGAALAMAAQGLMSWGFTWREIFYIFGTVMFVFLLPLTIGVLRRRPEDMGLLPDGEKRSIESAELRGQSALHESSSESYNWTLKQALKTRTFWYLVFAMAIGVMANGGIGFHQFAYFRDQGISQTMAAIALSSYALSGAVANVLWGLLVEKISERLIAVVTMGTASLLCLFLIRVDSFPEAMIFAILFGLAARGESSIIMMMQANYYGRKSFGAISGFSTPFQQIGLGLGPTLAAIPYDLFGTYNYGFVGFALLYVISGVLIVLAKRPSLPHQTTRSLNG
jgi:MFS family permease